MPKCEKGQIWVTAEITNFSAFLAPIVYTLTSCHANPTLTQICSLTFALPMHLCESRNTPIASLCERDCDCDALCYLR